MALSDLVDRVAATGATPLVVAEGAVALGVIELRDVIKDGIRECCARLRELGVRTVMVTGDQRTTALAIAAEVGVDDVLAEATPARKLDYIRARRRAGERIAMCGDGTNDAPALAQADVALVMNTGTAVARNAGTMVDLDSNPAKFVEIIETGRQMLLCRRALVAFGLSAEAAMYVAVLGAAVAAGQPRFHALNVLHLASFYSAILSAVFVSALLIMVEIPFALSGIASRRIGTAALTLAGVLMGFAGIKLIDAGLVLSHLV